MKNVISCIECGHEISLNTRRNFVVKVRDKGYKYIHKDFFLRCPHCNAKKEINYNKIPFIIKVLLFLEGD